MDMANANKERGNAAERAVRDYLTDVVGEGAVIKTRAGFNDDLGDVLADLPAGRLVVQVKAVKTPKWHEWFEQVTSQVAVCRRESAPQPVVGGIVVSKRIGVADPGRWIAAAPLSQLMELIDAVYREGVEDGKAMEVLSSDDV